MITIIFGLPYSGKSYVLRRQISERKKTETDAILAYKINEHDFDDVFDDKFILGSFYQLEEIIKKRANYCRCIYFDSLSFLLYSGSSLRGKGISNDLIFQIMRLNEISEYHGLDLVFSVSPFSSDPMTINLIVSMLTGCTRQLGLINKRHELRFLDSFASQSYGHGNIFDAITSYVLDIDSVSN